MPLCEDLAATCAKVKALVKSPIVAWCGLGMQNRVGLCSDNLKRMVDGVHPKRDIAKNESEFFKQLWDRVSHHCCLAEKKGLKTRQTGAAAITHVIKEAEAKVENNADHTTLDDVRLPTIFSWLIPEGLKGRFDAVRAKKPQRTSMQGQRRPRPLVARARKS